MANLSKLSAGDILQVRTKTDTWVNALNSMGGDLLDSGHIYQGADSAGVDAPYHRSKDTGGSGIDFRVLNDAGVVAFQLNTGTEGSPTWATCFTLDLTNRKFSVGDTASSTKAQLHVIDGGSDNNPGLLVLYDDAGADYFFWVDTSGNFRYHTSAPADDDADGTIISTSGNVYGEMYQYEAAYAVVIDTADKYHLIRNFSTGSVSGWTFNAGSTGPIASFSDYSGTVPGTVKATDVAHGLVTGDIVSITGATSAAHNGVFSITRIDADNFYFTATWGADSTATWSQGSYLKAGSNAAGTYRISWSLSGSSAVASKTFHGECFKNATGIDTAAAMMTPSSTSVHNCSSGGIVTIVANDRISFGLKNETDANDFTLEMANVCLIRI